MDQVNAEQNIGDESRERKTEQGQHAYEEVKSYCSLCGNEMQGGLWTNGDGFGDAKYVDVAVPRMTGFCWACVENRRSEVPEFNAQIDAAFAARGWCGFLEAWIGRCRNPQPCAKHSNETCSSCGARAIRNCNQTGQFVCGAPLCGECEHFIFPSGTNGGVGFNAEPLPEGMKRHCKKSMQQNRPWYARPESAKRPISDQVNDGQAS